MPAQLGPRIAFWTSAFEPEMEAVASEVALLRRHFHRSIAWGLSHRHWVLASWRRGFCLHPNLHLCFRVATRVFEPVFEVNHVFGSLGDWFYLHGKKRRPTVLTMATMTGKPQQELLSRISLFVAEHPGGVKHLENLGIDADRIRLVYPPVDLDRFRPTAEPPPPFTAVFASSPDMESALDARGVPLILEAARQRPGMRFRLLWRPWGNSETKVRQWISRLGLTNVELTTRVCADMAEEYRGAHVTLAPFTDPAQCKPAPNSLVESLACGRPVITTQVVGLANLIREAGAGTVIEPSGDALAQAMDQLAANWSSQSQRARRLAEQVFGERQFVDAYREVYRTALGLGTGR
ncbi:MAG: glycosyltransferase [Planctomycetota bacterium]